MLKILNNKRALQIAFAMGGLVPVMAGGAGVLFGANILNGVSTTVMDSHYRYLSGLLLGIGLAFWCSIPKIENQTMQVRLLTAIVFIGGIARLIGVFVDGWPSTGMCFGLVMELVITPLLYLWQTQVAKTSIF